MKLSFPLAAAFAAILSLSACGGGGDSGGTPAVVNNPAALTKTDSAIGTGAEAATPAVCSFQAIVPKTTDWRTYETRYVWLDGQDRPEFEPSYSVKS